ncbi:MAG: PTS sugar transporter subunit IIA [Planctomycetes bacterium]|nr:PTS sugar transporter subunit IIA [Planctomycetota bacterium]
MPLSLDEAAKMLGVSSGTVRRWAREGLLGVRRPSGGFRFETSQLRRWARSQGLRIHDVSSVPVRGSWPALSPPASDAESNAQPLTFALSRGGVVEIDQASTSREVMREMVNKAPLAPEVDREDLFDQLLQREGLTSTGLGDGVALPHPRQPSAEFSAQPMVVLAQLKPAIDWRALDGKPVHSVLLLLNPSPNVHLKILSRLAFLLRDAEFQQLLEDQADFDKILAAVATKEPVDG